MITDVYEVDTIILGEGSYGLVKKATSKRTGATFAVKSIGRKHQPEFQEELALFESMDHPNIIKLHESIVDDLEAHFIFELCTGGDLYHRLMARNTPCRTGRFDENETALVMRSVFDACAYMHRNHICHRDLKLENVMCTTMQPIRRTGFKVIDFGTACTFADGEKFFGKVGSYHYLSPQVYEGRYDCSVDVWSLGVLSHILLSGSYPSRGKGNAIPFMPTFEAAVWQGVSEGAELLLTRLLMYYPEDRYTAEEALQDAWVQEMSTPTQCQKWTNIEKEGACDDQTEFAVGDRVVVKDSVKEPKLGWGGVRHSQVGIISSIEDDGILNIDFAHFDDWAADPLDMQHASLATCSTRCS